MSSTRDPITTIPMTKDAEKEQGETDRRIDRPWWTPSSYGRHEATLPSTKHTTINLYTM